MVFSKKISLIIISIVLGLSLIAGVTTAIVVTQPKTDAYIGTESSLSIGNLLNSNGTAINQTTYNTLIERIGAIGTVSGTQQASAINGGDPVIFQMGGSYWQVVYRTGDYITVWLCEPYTRGSAGSGSVYSYNSSNLRTTANNRHSSLINNYPMLVLTTNGGIVATPNIMEDATGTNWQSTQDKYNRLSGVALDDGFWIPSYTEISSLWGVDNNSRGCDYSSANRYWTRTKYSESNNSVWALDNDGSGGATSGMSNSYGIRFATHLSLINMQNYFYTVKFSSPNGSISSNAVSNSSYNLYYAPNSVAILTATPNENYGFVSWVNYNTGQVLSTDNILMLTITSDMSITANFSAYITIHNGTSQIPNYKIANDEAQMTMKLMIYPDTGQFINSISFDNINFYPIDSWRASIYGACPFALYTEYFITANSNYFGLSFDFVTYEKAINIYVTTTTTPYGNLDVPNDGASVSGVAVSSTKGGSVTMVGNNLDEMEDTDYITCVAKVCLQGYEFKGWYNANDMETCLSTSESTNFTKAQIEDSQIVAVFEPIENDSINDDVNN